ITKLAPNVKNLEIVMGIISFRAKFLKNAAIKILIRTDACAITAMQNELATTAD
ncbi:MAG: hypothetical protein EZS28_039198, partial [Streblomastix strix]